MISRRQFSLGAGAAAVAAALPVPAWASRRYSPQDVLDNLSKALWASTKPGASRAAYVIAAPWCGVCQRLYQMQAELDADCDFRFVFQDPRRPDLKQKINEAVLSDSADKPAVVYAEAPGAELNSAQQSSDFITDVNTATTNLMWDDMRQISRAPRMGYPTLVAPLESGTVIIPGLPNNFEELVGKIVSHAGDGLKASAIHHLASEPPVVRSRSGTRYAKAKGTLLYAAPDRAAPVMDELGKGSGYDIAGTATTGGGDWVAFRVFNSGTAYLWGLAEDFTG